MLTRRTATALLSCAVVVISAGSAQARRPQEEVLTAEAERLAAHASGLEGAGALAALATLDEDVDPQALESAVRAGVAKGAHPLVAAQASWFLAHLEDQRGQTAEAASLRASLGLLSHTFVIGPFGEGRASLNAAFPPETEAAAPDLTKTYPGKTHEVGWRSGDAAMRDGVLYLDGMLRPADQAVAYVVAFVRSERDRAAVLRLGSPGPIKVWVNGAAVFTHDVVRPPSLDQDAVGIRLGRGWNRILIKTVISDGAWRLFARVTDAAGTSLGLRDDVGAPPLSATMARRASSASAPRADTLDALLERRARRLGAAGGRAWVDLARVLAWTTPRNRDDRAASVAFTQAFKLLQPTGSAVAPPEPALRLAAAEATDDDDERRRMLEQAVDAQPPPQWRALLLARVGVTARAARRDARALEAWREALAINPECWPAALAIAQEEADAGLPLTAVTRLEALPAFSRALPRVRRAAVRLYDAAGRQREADRVLADLAQDRRQDTDLMHQLSIRARRRGDGDEARTRLAAVVALRPDVPSLEIELARLMEGAGDAQRALATLRGLAARLPEEPAALVALGKLLHRMGKGDEAVAPLRTALALRPQDPELKRYLDRLAAGEHGDVGLPDELARRFAEDAIAMLPPAAQATADPTGSGAVVLLDRRVVRVHQNGLSRTFAQRVVQVLTERGAEENKEFAVHYTPGREEVDIRQARVYRRNARGDLTMLEATDRSDEDSSEPWYGLYYDNRAEVVRFEGLRPGDVVEIQYLVDDVGGDNQMADYFGDLQFVGETIPKRRWDYTLIAPVSRPIYANVPRLPRLDRQVTVEGNDRVYRFAARDVAKVDAEPAMPGIGETSPYLHVSTYASWNDVGAWYWHLVEESLTADDEVRRTARGLVKRGMSDADRARAVYDFVVKSTRYVGLEFGIHGYKPYKVTQVLARRFGDCKDKAALTIALLREVGVPAELVLVRTRRGGHLDPEPGVAGDLRPRHRLRSEARSVPRRDGRVLGGVRAAGPGSGRRRAAGRPARQRPDADAGAAVQRQPRRAPLAGGAGGFRRRARRRGADHPRTGGAQLARALPDRRRAQGSLRARLEWSVSGRAPGDGGDAGHRGSERARDGAGGRDGAAPRAGVGGGRPGPSGHGARRRFRPDVRATVGAAAGAGAGLSVAARRGAELSPAAGLAAGRGGAPGAAEHRQSIRAVLAGGGQRRCGRARAFVLERHARAHQRG